MFLNYKLSGSILKNHFRQWHVPFQLVLILVFCATFSSPVIESANGQAAPAKSTPDTATDDKEKLNAPETVTLETRDKVELVCTYYPPAAIKAPADPTAKEGEADPDTNTEVVPVDGKRITPYIILHDWKSSRADTQALAKFLSSQGNAVITPDLRGHGESIRVVGVDDPIDVADFKLNEIGATLEDIETCKRFLVQKNNAGELNIDMLAVIAIGKTVPMATQWVVQDWTKFAPYSKGIKQAQDVKFLIMIAPERKLGPYSMNRSSGSPIFAGPNALPTIVSWSNASASASDSQSIYNRLDKKRPEPKDETGRDKTLFLAPLGGPARTGVQIASDESLIKLWQYFDKTISGKMNENLDKLPWQDRSKKP